MMFSKTIAAGLVAVSALAAVPANAASLSVNTGVEGVQFAFHNGRPHRGDYDRYDRHDRRDRYLSPNEVRRVLRGQGYRGINYLDRRGRIYEVRATNRRGNRVGLVVSARNGSVLNVYRR